ncbi:cell growth-regulating nucleolar protein [Heptranchias perlo]|uniref:cell growth-regulating nucleolar protein n=1 Tax=Heptranchias perlo TaxID=212740 RepID=UPI00355A2F01
MVFFICSGCGESVKKAQVEKHLNICRKCSCLSCIDCGKDFWGEDYVTHTKCISEDQKYGGKGYEAKAKKGDMKQQEWIQKIHEVMNKSNVSSGVREILEQMNSYDNIPRKKAKFQNWMKNSLNIYNEALQGQVWEIFAAAISNDKNNQQRNQKHSQNGKRPSESVEANQDQAAVAENEEKKRNKRERKAERQKKSKKEKKHLNSKEDENCLKHEPDSKTNQLEEKKKKKLKKKHNKDGVHMVEENGNQAKGYEQQDGENLHGNKKSKKRKHEKSSEDEPNSKQKKVEIAETEEVEENDEAKQGKFNWKRTIKIVLQQSPEQEISIKKLRKKVLSQYYADSGDNNYKSEEELLAAFNKKITCNPKFKVLKDKVKLVK